MSDSTPDSTAVLQAPEPSANRKVDTVPFVELLNGRLQGVVSSGSDVERVYCAFLEAGSGAYYSSTNNNRPDAGMDKRIRWLVEEAVAQFGLERVARYLQVPGDLSKLKGAADVVSRLLSPRSLKQEPAGTVFSRFLGYLRFVELEAAAGPAPEMSWFVSR